MKNEYGGKDGWISMVEDRPNTCAPSLAIYSTLTGISLPSLLSIAQENEINTYL